MVWYMGLLLHLINIIVLWHDEHVIAGFWVASCVFWVMLGVGRVLYLAAKRAGMGRVPGLNPSKRGSHNDKTEEETGA